MNRKILLHHIILTALALAVMFLPLEKGAFFGSEGDWYSQHVGAAQAIRQTILDSGNPFPQFINIGGGINAYDLAYYGLFRPDVMISYLFPYVEMKYFIAGYAVLGVLASVNLMYLWLRKKRLSLSSCLAGGILTAGAICFFQAHHQIMFVNYMPFLILALMGIDFLIQTGKITMAATAVFFIMIHSFYYGPTCLIVCLIYFLYNLSGLDRKLLGSTVKKGFGAVFLGTGISAVLLIPTMAAILSTIKDSGSFSSQPIGAVDLSMESLLYDPYGCGLTLICLFTLLLSLFKKEKRLLAAVIIAILVIPSIWFVLSGFLYPRTKILIPFMPLITWICAEGLEDIKKAKWQHVIPALAMCLIPAFFSDRSLLIFIDWFLLAAWVMIINTAHKQRYVKTAAFAVMMVFPLCVSIGAGRMGEDYIRADDIRQGSFELAEDKIQEIASGLYRFDYISDSLANSNFLPGGGIKKTAMYSSITNDLYAKFYYDIMDNSIRYRNRVILAPDGNPFFSYFMGLRYIVTDQSHLPHGYSVIEKQGNKVLAENKDVLPICFGIYGQASSQLVQIKKNPKDPDEFMIGKFPASINSSNKQTLTIPLAEPIRNKALIISFAVRSKDGKMVVIDINGMRNKLSDKNAPYPNENHVFTYVISSNDVIDELECVFSAGEYQIKDLVIATSDLPSTKDETIQIPKLSNNYRFDGRCLFDGTIDMEEDGYFITSYPYKKGYEILVDGKNINTEKVNSAFIGFPLGAGNHHIQILFAAPGFAAGAAVSAVSAAAGLTMMILNKIRREAKKNGQNI